VDASGPVPGHPLLPVKIAYLVKGSTDRKGQVLTDLSARSVLTSLGQLAWEVAKPIVKFRHPCSPEYVLGLDPYS
jgi:hypothetical protein